MERQNCSSPSRRFNSASTVPDLLRANAATMLLERLRGCEMSLADVATCALCVGVVLGGARSLDVAQPAFVRDRMLADRCNTFSKSKFSTAVARDHAPSCT